MSTFSRNLSGNDTIDRYPLPYEGRLTKIICITKEVFEKLKAAWAAVDLDQLLNYLILILLFLAQWDENLLIIPKNNYLFFEAHPSLKLRRSEELGSLYQKLRTYFKNKSV